MIRYKRKDFCSLCIIQCNESFENLPINIICHISTEFCKELNASSKSIKFFINTYNNLYYIFYMCFFSLKNESYLKIYAERTGKYIKT